MCVRFGSLTPKIRGLGSAVSIATLLFLSGAGHARAQSSDVARTLLLDVHQELIPGERIRLTAPRPATTRFACWYMGPDSDSMLHVRLASNAAPLRVHPSQIGLVERQVGSKRHVWVGAAVGCVIGTLVGMSVAPDEDPTITIPGLGLSPSRDVTVRMRGIRDTYIMMGSASGLVLGGVAGFFIRSDRWGYVVRFD